MCLAPRRPRSQMRRGVVCDVNKRKYASFVLLCCIHFHPSVCKYISALTRSARGDVTRCQPETFCGKKANHPSGVIKEILPEILRSPLQLSPAMTRLQLLVEPNARVYACRNKRASGNRPGAAGNRRNIWPVARAARSATHDAMR